MIEKFFVFLIGTLFGSFFSCLFFRFQKKNFVFSRSRCPHCQKKLSFFDLIPIVSFLILKGSCRYCKKKISFLYPLFEIASGFLFLFAFSLSENFLDFLFLAFVFSFLLLIFFFDLTQFQIPDSLILPLIFITFLYFLFHLPLKNLFFFHLLPALFVSFIFFSIFYFSKGRLMGENDSKLAFFISFYWGFPQMIFAFFFGFSLGFFVSLILILTKKKTLKSEVPLAPFLIFGFFFNFALPPFSF